MDSKRAISSSLARGAARLVLTLGLGAGATVPASASTEDVLAICLARGIDNRSICACAGEKLTGVIGAEAVRLYSRVGREFIGDMAKGMDMGLSWDMAIDVVSRTEGIGRIPLLERMNRAGRDHRIAIRQCRQGS
ncbi:MAG: hypothetical protein AAF577_12895 [Pseudomonadota bacterium]